MSNNILNFINLDKNIADLSDEMFLKTLVHESNNFLSPISGFTEILLMEETLSEQHQSYLQEITTAIQRHVEFNLQLLMLSGKLTPRVEEINSEELISQLELNHSEISSDLKQVVRFNSDRSWMIKLIAAINTFADSLQQQKTPTQLLLNGEYLQLSFIFSTKPESVKKERFFQPFYTSRKLSSEKGLGLCWLPAFMQSIAGEISLEIDSLGKIELSLFFPLSN